MRLSHSYSSLKMFDNCPKRYHHQRILKDVTDPGSEASIYGERVHKSFEDRLRDGTALPTELAHHEKLCAAIERMGGAVTAEKELVLNKNLVPSGWWDEDAWLRSKLDVFVVTDKRAVIMDWKTGKRRPDFFQLEISVVQTFIHYPEIEAVNTAFVWLKTGDVDSEKYHRKDFDALLKKVQDKAARIEEAAREDVWPAKPSGLCSFCPAKDICMFAQKSWKRRR